MANESNDFQNERPFQFRPLGAHNDGTDFSSAATVTIPAGATKLMIQTTDQDIRFTLDGTDPTTSKGFKLVKDRDPIIIPLSQKTTIKIIEAAATADVQYQFGF